MKKIISILILVCFINGFILEMPVFAAPFQGHAEVTDDKDKAPSEIFTGDTDTRNKRYYKHDCFSGLKRRHF